MNLLTRHLAAELARSYLIVGAALLVLFDLIAFLEEAQDIGDGHYQTLNALVYVLMSSPARLIDLTPFVCLLAALLGLSQFNRTSELTAVRSAGVSPPQMALVTILLALGYVVPVAGLDWAARSMYQDAILDRMHATSASGNALRGRGFWTVRHDTYVHVSEFDLTQQPKGIRVFEFDGNANLIRYLSARYADVLVSDQWQLHDVVEKVVTTGKEIRTETLAERPWTPIWDPTIDMYELPDNSLSLPQLRSRIGYQENVNQSVTSLEIELWNRAALPISGLIFTLFAIPFALKPKPRGGIAGQIAVGSMLALLIYLGQQLLINAGVLLGLPPALAVALPALAVLAIGLMMIRRTA